jgi:hypothetical protein
MVFWLNGRGFLSLLFLVGAFGLFGAVITFTLGDGAFTSWPWLWSVGFFLAAVANWIGGSRLNRAPLNPFKTKLRDRLFYRARNRFLSFPMEVWSGPMILLGVAAIVRGTM